MPGRTQPWPKSALCWSPTNAATGMARPKISVFNVPTICEESTTWGKMLWGISMARSNSSSHSMERMLSSMVREAFVASVTCARSLVK